MLEQEQQAVGDEVAGGLVAGDREQQKERPELEHADPLAVDLAGHERGHEIVARLLDLALPQLVRVLQHLEPGHHRVDGIVAVLGILAAQRPVAPIEELVTVVLGHAQQVRDHL